MLEHRVDTQQGAGWEVKSRELLHLLMRFDPVSINL